MRNLLRIFLTYIFLSGLLIAQDEQNSTPGLQPISLVNETSVPSSTVNGSVNVITGDFVHSVADNVVSGPDSYVLGRSYSSSDKKKHNLGKGWSFHHADKLKVFQPRGINYTKNPFDESESPFADNDEETASDSGTENLLDDVMEPFVEKSKPCKEKNPHTDLYLVEAGGSYMHFKGNGWARNFKPVLKKTGWTNIASGDLSGKTNINNYEVDRNSSDDTWVVRCGDGSKRVYKRLRDQDWHVEPGRYNFHFRDYVIAEERKPSGNRVVYKYDENHKIASITTMNANKKKVLSWVKFHRTRGKEWEKSPSVTISTSDGKKYVYKHQHFDDDFAVREIIDPVLPKEVIRYSKKKRVAKTERADNFLRNFYYNYEKTDVGHVVIKPEEKERREFLHKRVAVQKSPIGPGGEEVTTHKYFYHRKHKDQDAYTTVVNALGYHTRYHYNKDKRLTRIEKFDEDKKLLMAEEYNWGDKGDKEDEGCLLARTVFNENNKAVFSREYSYDDRGNVVKESLYGNFTGSGKKVTLDKKGFPIDGEKIVTRATFSRDDFNLKLSETDALGNTIYYEYKPGTNLIAAKFVCSGNKDIRVREFFKYNDSAILIEHITDDGSSRKKSSLKNVNYRLISRVKPRERYPHYGEPEVELEYAVDLDTKKEVLLHKTVNTFNKKGLVVSKKLFDGKGDFFGETRLGYDDHGRVVKTIDPAGRESTVSYDRNGRIKCKRGPRNDCETRFTYDDTGKLLTETEVYSTGVKLTTSYTYDLLGRKIAVTNPQGHKTKITYDALDRITSISLPAIKSGSATKTYSYKNLGSIVKETDERGYTTTHYYNSYGKLIKELLPDGTVKTKTYDLLGNIVKEVEPTGLVSTHSYDFLGRCVKSLQRSGDFVSVKKVRYNIFHPVEEISSTCETLKITYDFACKKIKESLTSADGTLTKNSSYIYDSLGRLQESRSYIDSERYLAKRLRYDLLGRVVYEEQLDDKGHLSSYQSLTYDLEGNIASKSTSINGVESTNHVVYGPGAVPTKIIDPVGAETRVNMDYFFYDGSKYVIKKTTTDPRGVSTEELFNVRGQVASVTTFDPLGKKIAQKKLFYDRSGNNYKIVDVAIQEGSEKEIVTRQVFGACNRVEAIVQAAATDEEKTTRFYYNAVGQLESTLHANGVTIRHQYDAKGRMSRHFSEANTFDYSFAYDAADRVLEAKNHLTNSSTKRLYDGLGRLSSEVLESGLALNYTYDLLGRVGSVTLPDSSKINYSYDGVFLSSIERLTAENEERYRHKVIARDLSGFVKEVQFANGSSLQIQRDLLGRATDLTHDHFVEKATSFDPVGNLLSVTTTDPQGEKVENYGYDFLSQLLSETDHSYTYDSLFNRLSKDSEQYKVNSLHSILSAGETNFRYDAAGNRVEKISSDVSTAYRYDELDRLIAHGSTTYQYDAFHRRISKTSESGTDYFLYTGDNEIGLATADGAIHQLRVLGEGLGAEIGAAVAIEVEGQAYIPIHDRRGNVRVLLDMDSNVVESYRYSAFGEELCSTITPINPWRFSSKRVDEESGLVYFGRRYYDSSVGKWLTQDPLGLKAGPNLYAYVLNGPLTHFDLYGLIDENNSGGGFWGGVRDACSRACDRVTSIVREVASGARDVICGIGKAAASVVDKTIYHTVPSSFGGGKEKLCNYFRSFAGQSPREYNHSQSIQIYKNDKAANNGGTICKVVTIMNGILTSLKEHLARCYKSLDKLDLSNTLEVHCVYRATTGFSGDLLGVVFSKLGIQTHACKVQTNVVKGAFDRHGNRSYELNVYAIGHSAGGTDVFCSTKHLSDKLQRRMNLHLFGSASVGYGMCGEADINAYIAKTDLVSWIGDPAGTIYSLLTGTMKVYGSWTDLFPKSHDFVGPVYQNAFKDFANIHSQR